MSYQFIKLEYAGRIARLTISRPDKLNAINNQVVEELGGAIAEMRRKSELCCAVLSGAGGKAFVAGADIAEMQSLTQVQATAFAERGHRVCAGLENLPFPIIASVNGFALGGGCEIALACDFIYASDQAKLGQPEVKLGIIPGFGGTQRLARRVGIAKARQLIYTGVTIDAVEAHRIGLVDEVFPHNELEAKVASTAEQIASMGPLAIRAAKLVLRTGEGLPLPAANALEIRAFSKLFGSVDQQEGMSAFVGKRSAQFKGK